MEIHEITKPIRTQKYWAKYWESMTKRLLAELYKNEVIDTCMEKHIIGEGLDFASKEEWIENRLECFE